MMPQSTTTTTSSAEEEEEEEVRTLWIGDLEPWMSETYIYLCFEHAGGEVFTSRVIRDERTGKSMCFGFIQFETHAIADRILHRFNGTLMPMVIGTLFTLNWAVSDIFTTTSDTTNYQEEEEEEKEGTTDDGQCGFHCSRCSPFDKPYWLLEESHKEVVVVEEKSAGAYPGWEALMKLSTHGDSDNETSFCARVALHIKAKAEQRAAARAARRIVSATNKNTVGGGAPQEPQTVVDVAQRVDQIAGYIKSIGISYKGGVNTLEDLFDELKGYVKSIDVAKELHSTGVLSDILGKLSYIDIDLFAGCYRAKVAELVTAMVHNNPRGQQLLWEANGLRLLFPGFISGSDATTRTNSFYAISSLIWDNKPAITEFRRLNGYVELRDALLSSVSVAFQRKALDLIQHLLHENSSDYNIVTESGFPSIMMYLACSDDAEVREAALGCLLVLARVEEGENSGQLIKKNDKLKQVLKVLRIMAPEDLAAGRKERQLVDSLWNACYNKPFSPRGPQLFERPLRAWAADARVAAARAAYRNSVGEKEELAFFLPHSLKRKMQPNEDATEQDERAR